MSLGGRRLRRRPAQAGQMVEMEYAGYGVLVKRPLGSAIRECVGGAVFETSGAHILPHVALWILASAGGVYAHSSEEARGANPTPAEASGHRHLSRALPA